MRETQAASEALEIRMPLEMRCRWLSAEGCTAQDVNVAGFGEAGTWRSTPRSPACRRSDGLLLSGFQPPMRCWC